jgi:hypothetical protein
MCDSGTDDTKIVCIKISGENFPGMLVIPQVGAWDVIQAELDSVGKLELERVVMTQHELDSLPEWEG